MSNSHRAARAPKPEPGTTRRIVGNTLFIGGLVLCGGALVQPTQDAPSVLLTNGTTGGTDSSSSSGTSRVVRRVGPVVQCVERDQWWCVERDFGWFVEWDCGWFLGHDQWGVVEWDQW